MKSAWMVLSVIAILPASAWAQSVDADEKGPTLSLVEPVLPRADSDPAAPERLLPSSMTATEVVQEHFGHLRASLAVYGRISIPGSGDVSPDGGVTYQDIFSVGIGASLEGDILLAVGGGLQVGGYASIGYDVFGGRSTTDDFGNNLDVDDMRLTTVFIGGKIRAHHGPWFFWEGRLGLGLVHYDAVNATITDFGFPPVTDRLFRATNRGAFEIGGMAGWGTPHFAVEFGLGYRIMGAPERGKNVSTLVDPDLFDTFDIEAGVRLLF